MPEDETDESFSGSLLREGHVGKPKHEAMGNHAVIPYAGRKKILTLVLLSVLAVFCLYTLDPFARTNINERRTMKYDEISIELEPEVPHYTHDRNKHDGKWVSFQKPYELFAYSAFYDERKSLGTLPVVRVIIVSETLDERQLYCKVMYLGNKESKIMSATYLDIGMGIYKNKKNFKEYVVACQLDDEDVPYLVSLLPSPEVNSSFVLPVHVPYKPLTKLNFIACISVSYWKQNPYRIVEWMELLRLFGVSKVTIYNNSLPEVSSSVFQHYDKTGFVDFRQSHNFVSDKENEETTIHMHMSPVINDCMYRNMHSYRKVVVTDLDEIITPRVHSNYAELLVAIDKEYPSRHPARNYVFSNAYFFTDIPSTRTKDSHIWTLTYLKRLPPSPTGVSVKSIIDPQACTNMHNHYCWGLTRLYRREGDHTDVDPRLGLNQHYKKCHLDIYDGPGKCAKVMKTVTQDNTMLRFEKELTERINKQLDILGLPRA